MGNGNRNFVHKVVGQRWLQTLLVCEHHEPQVIPEDVHDFLFPFPTPISCSHPHAFPVAHKVLWIMSIFDIHFITSMYGHINRLWHIPVYYSPATVHKEYRNLLQKWQNTMLGKHTRLGTAAITIRLQIIVAVCFVSLRLVGLLRYHTVACTCWGTLINQNLVSWMPCTGCCKSLDIYLYQL